ncbi:uncharacterized protein DNG_01192 [Cephalotrichum gorgonifer]|uniref:Uncharacterized protein n=1 Tax=Cephalotrichum gorgonifer TaxID=2041049 RepID=A0AAE8SRE9_9PEZI|nr:uncharacterized protein DNG_01192 [Cephalotrichum gorgonifer]
MLGHIASGASSLLKRSLEDGLADEVASWLWPVLFLQFVGFFPILLLVSYTFGSLFPALAIVEDDTAPPSYQALSLGDGDVEEGGEARNEPAESDRPITSSLRSVYKLVKSIAGWRSLFRGLAPLLVATGATNILHGIIAAPFHSLGSFNMLAAVPSYLALVQLHTVWLHVVITPSNPLPFYRRLPPFGKTLRATALPFALYAVTLVIAKSIWLAVFSAVNHGETTAHIGLFTSLIPLAFVLWITLVLPAYIALLRIQASLLPPDEDPIVPFDRSFGGRVTPVLSVGEDAGKDEKTYATLGDVWATLSRPAIWRVAKLVLKATGIYLGVTSTLGLVAFGTAVLGGVKFGF